MKLKNSTFWKACKSEFKVRKIISIALLVFCMFFVIYQRDSLSYSLAYVNGQRVTKISKSEKEPYKENPLLKETVNDDYLRYQLRAPSKNVVSMKGDVTLRQTFTAQESQLKRIWLFFHNPGNYSARGTVIVSIEDKDGNEVCSSHLAANLVLSEQRTQFDFTRNNEQINANHTIRQSVAVYKSDGIDIRQGEVYTLVIRSEGVSSDDEFSICLGTETYSDADTMTVNGEDRSSERILGAIVYNHVPYGIFTFFIICFLAMIVIILLPFGYFSEKISQKSKKEVNLDRLITRILFFLTPLFAFYICYKVTAIKLVVIASKLVTFQGLLNLLIIVIMWFVVYAISNRTKVTIYFVSIFYFSFVLLNYILNVFRGSPLVATDFLSVGTAMDVAANYVLIFSKSSLWIIVVSGLFFAFAYSREPYQGGVKKKLRIVFLVIAALSAGGLYYTLFVSDFIENHHLTISGFDTRKSYKKRGYPLSFLISITLTRVDKPDGYSVDAVRAITDRYESDPAASDTEVSETHPNIIVIMNEAYSDLSANGDFKVSGPYMPFVNGLKEDTVKGRLHMSIFGGSTANSEFEFLTGDTIAFLPFHTVAYNNFIHENQPSTTTTLKDLGYKGNIAFHPGMRDSYNRNNVYPCLGFDKQISLEDLEDPDYMRSFVSDDYDFRYIEKQYEEYKASGEKAPFWLFNVTIQNHSGFTLSTGVVEKEVTITDENANGEEAQQYLNLIKKTDEAFENMVNYFKKVKEPTIIVMYGDHQPRVEDAFYSALHKRLPSEMTELEKGETMYQVPFIMWANYDIEEESDLDLSDNYLSAYVRNKVGSGLTGYDKFLLDLHKKVPVFSAICYIGDDGVMYDPDAESAYSKDLSEYEMLQYNNLIDRNNRVEEFFRLKK